MTTSQHLGPIIPRRRLGAELRRLRHERGMLLGEVAQQLMISTSKLSRLEKGQGAPQDRDVRDLLNYYDLTGTDLGERMWSWAKEGRETPWWNEATDEVRSIVERYVQFETAATLVRGYIAQFVPSLLQTPEYARAHVTAMLTTNAEEVAEHVDLRLRRQQIIARKEYPVSIDFVLDESVFHRMVGTPTIMREQLLSLVRASEQPNVTLRIFPFANGPQAAITEGTYCIFQFRRPIDQDVVNVESMLTESYIDQPERVERYRELLDSLEQRSLNPDASREFIRSMSDSYLSSGS